MRGARIGVLGLLLGTLPLSGAVASTPIGTEQSLVISATISDAMCEVQFDTTRLIFTPTVTTQFSAGSTVEILPLKMRVKCNHARTPTVSITGAQPYAGNTRVFLDPPAGKPNGNGVGFMVQPATTAQARDTPPVLSTFYAQGMAGAAVQAGVSTDIIPVTQTQNFVEQVLWIGLVGEWSTDNIQPGEFKSTLTITVAIP